MTSSGNKIILDISRQNREFVDMLRANDTLGFKSLNTKDVFKFVCALGLKNPTDFRNKDTYVRIEFLSNYDKAILITTKLGLAKTTEEIDKYCNIEYSYGETEKCANTGFEILRKKVEDANGDEELLASRMLIDLDILYQQYVKK